MDDPLLHDQMGESVDNGAVDGLLEWHHKPGQLGNRNPTPSVKFCLMLWAWL